MVDRLLAVQGQDARGFRLAVRARSRGVVASDVNRALTVDRSLVVSWLNRGTLHLVRSADHGWLHALTTPPLATGSARRLAQEGVPPNDAERGIAAVARTLDAGPATRAQLREVVAAAGVRVAGQALVHVLFAASLRGLLVRGPVLDGEQAFVAPRDWLGVAGAPWRGDRDEALGRLADRYLAGHAPASAADLARWAGLGLGDARRGLARLGGRVADLGGGLLAPTRSAQSTGRAPRGPRLLGAFDPVLLGWADRSAVAGDLAGIVTTNGVFRPFVLLDGRAVGLWSMPGGRVTLAEPPDLTDADRRALAAEAADVTRFLTT